MSKFNSLDREALVEALARIEKLSEETATLWAGRVATHGFDCHLRHAGCLAQAVLDVVEDLQMLAAQQRVERILGDAAKAGGPVL